jgi:predicted aldo/keto reductase-like oxidoreductase
MRDVENQDAMDRRSFLKTGLQTGAVALAATTASAKPAPAAGSKQISLAGPLPQRMFGRTGHTLPILGHGGSAIIDQEKHHYGLTALPAVEERIAMVRAAYEKGVRYFDTARIYGESESIFGKALKDVREDVFIASKSMVFGVDGIRASVEKSLEQLGTPYLDSLQLHGPVIERLGYDGCMPIVEEMLKLKAEGHFRFLGLTGHSRFEEMHKLIASNHFDTLLIERGYFHKGYNTRHSTVSVEWRDLCMAKAHELNVGIVAMKVLGANIFGHNAQNIWPEYDPAKRAKLPGAAIRYVLSDPRVNILLLGVSLPSDVDQNIATLTADTAYTNEDRAMLAEFSAKAYEAPVVTELKIV